jgi:hypothetical protein
MLALGGVLGGLGSLGGKKGKFEQVSRLTPEQQNLFSSLLGNVQGPTTSGLEMLQQLLSGDESAFAKFEAPYKRQFQQEVVPGIMERLAGAGTHGAQSSSALNQSLAQAGRELTEQLASLRGGLQQNALGQLQGLLGQSMQPTFESVYQQPQQGFLGGLLGGAGQGLSQYGALSALSGLGGSPAMTKGAGAAGPMQQDISLALGGLS